MTNFYTFLPLLAYETMVLPFILTLIVGFSVMFFVHSLRK